MGSKSVAVLTLVALAFVALAGCSGSAPVHSSSSQPSSSGLKPIPGGNSGSSGPNGTSEAPGNPPARNGTSADNVHISDGGDLSMGASKHWNWTVYGNWKTLRADLQLLGPQGGPAVEVVNLEYTLRGGNPVETKLQDSRTVGGGSPFCECYDGANGSNPYGDWSIDFATGQSAASFTLEVVVEY